MATKHKIGDLLRILFVEYQVFTTAFAVVLAGSVKSIIEALINYLIYPLFQRNTGWIIDEKIGNKVNIKKIIDQIIRFVITLSLVYIAYKYREQVLSSLGIQ